MINLVKLFALILLLGPEAAGNFVDNKMIKKGWSLADGEICDPAFVAPTDGYFKLQNDGPGHMAIWIHYGNNSSQTIELSPGQSVSTTLFAGTEIEARDERKDGKKPSHGSMAWTPY